jgi:hypothetical protein
MTEQQQIALRLARDLGADPREIERALSLARTGRIDLILACSAKSMTIRAALKAAKSNSPRQRAGRGDH